MDEFKQGQLVKKVKGSGQDGFDLWDIGDYGTVIAFEINATCHPVVIVYTEKGIRTWYAKYVKII